MRAPVVAMTIVFAYPNMAQETPTAHRTMVSAHTVVQAVNVAAASVGTLEAAMLLAPASLDVPAHTPVLTANVVCPR